ncbi:hypothetical protein ACUN0C_07975 [Faunimonas sp. B44]|uniref:hypothetical protein n=1 Tax=Faunimonas sp. B44 TaxID=3461493 RepID=UPI004043CD84
MLVLAVPLAAAGCGTDDAMNMLAPTAYQTVPSITAEPSVLEEMAANAPSAGPDALPQIVAPAPNPRPDAAAGSVAPMAPPPVAIASVDPVAAAPSTTGAMCRPGQVAVPVAPPRAAAVAGRSVSARRGGVWTGSDLPGPWLASDGSPGCGCQLTLGPGPGGGPATSMGCVTPDLGRISAWHLESIGFGNPDLLLLGSDGRVVARLDARGSRYFDGAVAGTPFTLWR